MRRSDMIETQGRAHVARLSDTLTKSQALAEQLARAGNAAQAEILQAGAQQLLTALEQTLSTVAVQPRLLRGDLSAISVWEKTSPSDFDTRPELNSRRWRGEDLAGKTILVYPGSTICDGFGDQILLLRYVPWLVERGARALVETPPELTALFATFRSDCQFVAPGHDQPFDFAISGIMLPAECRSTIETIPRAPYLSAPADRRAHWRTRLGEKDGRLRIALSWSGEPVPTMPARLTERWSRLADLAPVLAVPGLRFFSVRKGMTQEELQEVSNEPRIEHIAEELRDFADTAAVLDEMDLVVSTDGSVVHVAGAIGKPVWVMLNTRASWIYFEERDDSPWYPSARLFRQPDEETGWGPVVERIAGELRRLTAEQPTLDRFK